MTDTQLLVVKMESPVADQKSKLYRWDASARHYFSEFELDLAGLKTGMALLYKNPLTSFRDPVQFGHRYAEV
jgi:hypothetical protein